MRPFSFGKLGPWLALLIAIFFWALTGALGRWLDLPSNYLVLALSFVGFLSCYLFSCLLHFFKPEKTKSNKINPRFYNLWSYAKLGFFFYLLNFFYFESLRLGSATSAVALLYTAPFWVLLLDRLASGEKTRLEKTSSFIPVFLCLLGTFFLLSDSILNFSRTGDFSSVNVLYGLFGGFFFAVYTLEVAKTERCQIDSAPLLVGTFGAASVIGLIVYSTSFLSPSSHGHFDLMVYLNLRGWSLSHFTLAISAAAILCFVLPYFAYNQALKKVPAGPASLLTLSEPIFNIFWVWLFSGEHPSYKEAWAALIIGLGLLLLVRETHFKKA